MLISTGIEMLDRILHGGINPGSSVLLMSTPGVEDIQFAQQCFFTHLSSGGRGIYLVNNKKPAIVREMLKDFDWDISKFEKEGKCAFLDCYSALLAMGSQEKKSVRNPADTEELLAAISRVLEEDAGPLMLVFDSLSSLIDTVNSEDAVLGFLRRLSALTAEKKATLVSLFTQWPYDASTIKEVEERFDCVIRLKAIEQKVILRSYFSVDKAKWLERIEKREIPYKVINPGGVKVFIPKILVTGPFNAGKTSFIHSVSTKAVSVDRLGTTVALDHGHVDYKGFAVDLFGTPGQERFDPILDLLGGEALGVIVVVDSTDPSGFARAKDMLKVSKTEGLPVVIVANKANMEGALKPEEIRRRMTLPEDVMILPVVAENLDEVKENEPCRLRKEDVAGVFDVLFRVIV
jgi:hypothetical protein